MDPQPNRTRIRDAVALMVVCGTWLVMPPVLSVVNQPTTVLGVPTIVVFIFAVWAGLILATRFLARRSEQSSDRESG
jgi:hypothetical protein